MFTIRENTVAHLILSHLHPDFYVDYPSLRQILAERQPLLNPQHLRNELSRLVKSGYVTARPIFDSARTLSPSRNARHEYTRAAGWDGAPRAKTTAWTEGLPAARNGQRSVRRTLSTFHKGLRDIRV